MCRRPAFTLLEIVVVVAVLLVLTALTAAVLPGLRRQEAVTSAAGQLQGWLLEARSRAARDRVVGGLRLFADPDTATVRQVLPVQDPGPWATDGTLDCLPVFVLDAQGHNVLTAVRCTAGGGLDLTGGLGLGQPGDWPVRPGDALLFGDGPPHRAIAITAGGVDLYAPALGKTFPLDATSDGTAPVITPGTANFAFARRPRATTGEPFRPLAAGAVVDVALGQLFGALLVPGPDVGSWDVLFAPAGTLSVTGGGTLGTAFLWVREADADAVGGGSYGGAQLIVSVNPAGAVAVNPVVPGGSPFVAARDPRGSGF